MPKRTLFLAGLLALAVCGIFVFFLAGGYFHHFPDEIEIDRFFMGYNSQTGDSFKQESLRAFLQSMSGPRNAQEDKRVYDFLNRLQLLFLSSEDENILAAVEKVKIDAGFANCVSGFCYSVKHTETFRNRYRNNGEPLKRYIGLSFSQEEVDQIARGQDAQFTH